MPETVGSCISAANGSASDNLSTTGKAIFELWCGLCLTILCQGSPRKEIEVKCYLTILICSCQGTSSQLVINFMFDAFIAALERYIAQRDKY